MSEIIHKELSYKINGLCFQVQKELGRFCRERQYADRLEELLKMEHFLYKREFELIEFNANSPKGNRADFLIENQIILDAKAKSFITNDDYAQMQRYLRGANLKLGLIVNFKDTYLKPKRVLNSHHSPSDSHFSHRSKGFTLVELAVSIAIFLVIMSVITVSQHRFGGNILITNLAYDVALGIRQAQVYGISVKHSSAGFDKSYGVHFGPPGYFILFVDNNDNKHYEAGGDDGSECLSDTECVSFFKIEKGNSIAGLCAGNPCDSVASLDIVFHRPDPEPVITANGQAVTYLSALVTVSSPQGVTKGVKVLGSGQISIK
ncbi:MAG: GxxExxY protein [Candidatus Taylorbacteria bacterium]|nr:GxxExxY protein [Candidatus Taylorbacteria bacterium]